MPPDDALRHVGQAVCQKSWSDILVIKGNQSFDIHYGWKRILYFLSDSGVPKTALLQFSVVFFFLLNFFCPLFIIKKPEAWALSLIVGLCLFSSVGRYTLGRPFLSQVAAVVVIGLSSRDSGKDISPGNLLLVYLFLTFSICMRALWFLYLLPITCFLLTGQPRKFSFLVVVWILSTITAGMLSGDIISFFSSSVEGVLCSTNRDILPWMLVSELVPKQQSIVFFLPIISLLIWRKANDKKIGYVLRDPMLLLIIISWVLSMKINRFWADFGVPAYFVWLYGEFCYILDNDVKVKDSSFLKVATTLVAFFVLFFIMSGDFNGRWSRSIYTKAPDINETETRGWLPEENGIFYNISMNLFYKTFYTNPNAPWKYFLGAEAASMPKENMEIYHQIILSLGAKEKLQLIVDKMTLKDRFVLENNGKPDIDGLEWFEIKPNIWSGRMLPKN